MSTSVDTERERAVSQSTGLLNLLIDRTGIKAEGEGEWNARRPEARAVEVTGNNIGDAPMLPELLNQIPSYQDIGSVTADGAYDTRKCHEAMAARDAHAVVPPRKKAKPG